MPVDLDGDFPFSTCVMSLPKALTEAAWLWLARNA